MKLHSIFTEQFWTRDIPELYDFLREYIYIVLASSVVSIAGIVIAVLEKYPADGGRGGALATCFSFAALFVRSDNGTKLYKARMEDVEPGLPEIERLAEQSEALVQSLEINSDSQKYQNWAIAIAAIIGTLVWGFGDMVACLFVKHCLHCP